MSQTHAQCLPTPTFSDVNYSILSHYSIPESLVILVLLGTLYGFLTVLSMLSVHALTQRRDGGTRQATIILCLIILILFTSTTVYMVAHTLYYQTQFDSVTIMSGRILWNTDDPIEGPLKLVTDYSQIEGCASTVALTINVTLGDAIVCWRACVIWRGNRIVRAICAIFLLTTFVFGIFDTTQACRPISRTPMAIFFDVLQQGTMYRGVPIGIAASVLSFCTNLSATLLVGFKAWESRKRLKGYLVAGSQVEKLLSLLLESGAMYCAIWTVVVAYQLLDAKYRLMSWQPVLDVETDFKTIFDVIMSGALIPAIAIYPTIIIVLVALNRSHTEKGLSQHLESIPTPCLAITANTIETRDTAPDYRRSGVLVIDGDGWGLRCRVGTEDSSKPIELKVDSVV